MYALHEPRTAFSIPNAAELSCPVTAHWTAQPSTRLSDMIIIKVTALSCIKLDGNAAVGFRLAVVFTRISSTNKHLWKISNETYLNILI